MNITTQLSIFAAGALLAAGAAQAGVSWSIGIDAPGVATVVSNQPVYRSVPPAYYAPAAVYAPAPVQYVEPRVQYVAPAVRYVPPQVRYVPAPVRYVAPPVRYVPAPVVYEQPGYYAASPVVVIERGLHHGDWGWRHRHDERWVHEREREQGGWDGRR